jgi:signal peptidase I
VPETEHTAADGQICWPDSEPGPRAGRAWHIAICVGLVLAIVVAAVAVASQLNRPPVPVYRVVSGSMEPTLAVGRVVHVDTSAYASVPPLVGDIVAFHAPAGAIGAAPACGVAYPTGEACPQSTSVESNQIFIKRVVAGPGDTIAVVNGTLVRNGGLQGEPFPTVCDAAAACNLPAAIKVPAGEWFLVGDDRERSEDSRSWGPIPQAWIVGRVVT